MYVNDLNQQNPRLNSEQRLQNNVAQEFNAYFVSHLIKLAHEQEPDPIFGGGFAEKVFKDLLLNEYGAIVGQKLDVATSYIQKYVDNQNVNTELQNKDLAMSNNKYDDKKSENPSSL